MKKLKGLFNLIRFELPFSAGVCVLMGQMLTLGEFASAFLSISAFLSVFFISASILVLNDYFDIETDKINAPHRPIPSGLVSATEALRLSIFLLAVGLVLSLTISVLAFVCSAALLIIGFLYNRKFKKSGLPGNLLVSFSVGMTFIYGGVSVGLPFNKIVLFFGLIAALIDLGEEIAADAMDAKGDMLINSKSLAINFGRETALKVSAYIFLCVIILSFVPFLITWFSPIYLFPILLMDIAIGYSTLKLLKSRNDEGRKYIRWIYLGGTFGLIVFIVMRITGL